MFTPVIFSVIVVPLYSKSTSKEVMFPSPKFLTSTEGFLCCPLNPVIGVIDDTCAFNESKITGV
jgi:hypothetical protein